MMSQSILLTVPQHRPKNDFHRIGVLKVLKDQISVELRAKMWMKLNYFFVHLCFIVHIFS